MNMHTSYTLTHTHTHTYGYRCYMDTDAQGNTKLCIHQSTFMPTYTSMSQHPRIYPHTCIHEHILAHTNTYTYTRKHTHTDTCTHAQALTHTCARMLIRTHAYKTKMRSQTLRTNTHKYPHTLK